MAKIHLLLLFTTLLLPSRGFCAAAEGTGRPNIIYILVDDAGYGDFGCYGQKAFTTPNIDRMAAEGMKFTRHYAGCTVCAPSRCVLMTGLHTGHCRVRGNGPGFIPDTDITVPKLLRDSGYATACIGKYGLGHPVPADDPGKKGFEHFFGYVETAHAHNCYPAFLVRDGKRELLDNEIIPGSEGKIEGTGVAKREGRRQWVPQLVADDVQHWLDDRGKDRGKPFFLYYSLNLPHANNEAGKKNSPLGHGLETPDYGEFSDRDWPDAEKGFASMMRFVDDQVGAVLAKVKELGLDDETIVFFSSDNGPHEEGLHRVAFFESNGGLAGKKRDLTDGGLRVPFIARWPGKIKAGGESGLVSGFQDFLPTAADLAQASNAPECDGVSLVPALLGRDGDQKAHPFLFWNFMEEGGKQAVLQWPWKLIRLRTDFVNLASDKSPGKSSAGPERDLMLFNLEADPAERVNLAGKNQSMVKQLDLLMKESWKPSSDSFTK